MDVLRVTGWIFLMGGTAIVFGATLLFMFVIAPTILRRGAPQRGAFVLAHALAGTHKLAQTAASLGVVGGALAVWLTPTRREALGTATVLVALLWLSLLELGVRSVRRVVADSPGPEGFGEVTPDDTEATAQRAVLEGAHRRVAGRYGFHLFLALGALLALAASGAVAG